MARCRDWIPDRDVLLGRGPFTGGGGKYPGEIKKTRPEAVILGRDPDGRTRMLETRQGGGEKRGETLRAEVNAARPGSQAEAPLLRSTISTSSEGRRGEGERRQFVER